MNNPGVFHIAYNMAYDKGLSVLSVFNEENGQTKMIKGFIGEKAENVYNLLTEQGGDDHDGA